MAAVVETDNYNTDAANDIAKVWNKHFVGNRYWKVVEDGYVLQPGFEP